MTRAELDNKVMELQEWESLLEEAKEMTESIKDQLKAELLDRDTEELDTGKFIIRYTNITSNRFDSTAFKKIYGDLYKAFTKQVASRRFTVSA
jgi:predicted phage-related endonuclease